MNTEDTRAYDGLTKDAYHIAREFTYHPIMSSEDCWFKVENKQHKGTYHQCPRHGKEKLGPFPFCAKHAARVIQAIEQAQIRVWKQEQEKSNV